MLNLKSLMFPKNAKRIQISYQGYSRVRHELLIAKLVFIRLQLFSLSFLTGFVLWRLIRLEESYSDVNVVPCCMTVSFNYYFLLS